VPVRVFETASAEESIALGERIAAELPPKAVVLLIGSLGAGKTTLTKGIVAGLGAGTREDVSSPTFTLIHEYSPRVYHIDLYRLDEPHEVASLGIEELLDREAVVLVEWGERFPDLFPKDRIEIRLQRISEDRRRIEISGLP
jgi:ATPase, YjeE family